MVCSCLGILWATSVPTIYSYDINHQRESGLIQKIKNNCVKNSMINRWLRKAWNTWVGGKLWEGGRERRELNEYVKKLNEQNFPPLKFVSDTRHFGQGCGMCLILYIKHFLLFLFDTNIILLYIWYKLIELARPS